MTTSRTTIVWVLALWWSTTAAVLAQGPSPEVGSTPPAASGGTDPPTQPAETKPSVGSRFRKGALIGFHNLLRGKKPAPTYADVAYGPGERNVMDIWLASSGEPTPVVVYFHGGGFNWGDKTLVHASIVEECMRSGISVVAANYTFTTQERFPAQQRDAARAIQFLRSNAREWNLDPKRIAAYGESAGAGLSLWLAFHDDIADPDNEDPVLRHSSRLTSAGAIDGQTTYDPHVIRKWVGAHSASLVYFLRLYDVDSVEGLYDPHRQSLYNTVSPIYHVSDDDPPVFLFNYIPELARPSKSIIVGIHHPVFAVKLREVLDRHGIDCVQLKHEGLKFTGPQRMLEFFKEQFEK